MSLLIPLLLFCALLYLNRLRARARQLPTADSWRAEALEAAITLVEAGAETAPADPPSLADPIPVRTIATVPVTARGVDVRAQRARYLLDGDHAEPYAVDRVARVQQLMRGPGLCSPRRSS